VKKQSFIEIDHISVNVCEKAYEDLEREIKKNQGFEKLDKHGQFGYKQ
jgi:hypothetical protein